MNTQSMNRVRMMLTAFVLLAESLHLTWEYTNGGVLRHHLLNRSDLPAISNWWGALLLPLLSWFLFGPLLRRVYAPVGPDQKSGQMPIAIIGGFVAALLYGLALATTFTLGYEDVTGYLFLGLFLLAVVIPLYRPEYILGLIYGMTFTFGAILPTIINLLIAAVSATLHFLVRQVFRLIGPRTAPQTTLL